MSFLEIDRAYKSYGPAWNHTEVLADINLQVERGEFVAIVGFSGAGKTTLVKGTSENPLFISWVSITGNNLILLTAIDQMA